MIRDAADKYVISSLGWADKNSLWVLNTDTEEVERVRLSDANYFSLHPGKENHFAVVHHFDNNRLEISAHSASAPAMPLANISLTASEQRFEGDSGVWEQLPKAYVSYYVYQGEKAYWLFLVDPVRGQVSLQQFEWYKDSYDEGYQGIIGVAEVPNQNLLLVSVQRDSHPVLYDPHHRRVIRKLSLADRAGNPRPRFRSQANELWVDDYDTLLKLDPTDWTVKASQRLQDAAGGTRQFIGEFEFNDDESLCAVARPFGGDVIALDTYTFKIRYRCEIGREPLQVAILRDGRVLARDWKTGALLKGRLKRSFSFKRLFEK
jgi:hypothetical protein